MSSRDKKKELLKNLPNEFYIIQKMYCNMHKYFNFLREISISSQEVESR